MGHLPLCVLKIVPVDMQVRKLPVWQSPWEHVLYAGIGAYAGAGVSFSQGHRPKQFRLLQYHLLQRMRLIGSHSSKRHVGALACGVLNADIDLRTDFLLQAQSW